MTKPLLPSKPALPQHQLAYLAKQVALVRKGLRTPDAAWAAYQAFEAGIAAGASASPGPIPYDATTALLKHFLGRPESPSSLAPEIKTEIARVQQEIACGDLLTKAHAHLL